MQSSADRLNTLLLEAGLEGLNEQAAHRFSTYLELLLKWNHRLNLTSIRSEEDILSRHFVECIFCARHLPAGITTLLDYGSGAGLPGIPISCSRSEIEVTLGEAQHRKSVFLRDVVRTLGLSARIFSGRCEKLPPASFDAVALRAVDKMQQAVRAAERLIKPSGWLILLVSSPDAPQYRADSAQFSWQSPLKTPGTDRGVLLMAQRRD